MSVIACDEIWEGRQGGDDVSAALSSTRAWRVITSDAQDSEEDIKISGVIPMLRSPHPKNPQRMWLDNRNFVQDSQDPKIWVVTCEYRSLLALRGGISAGGGGSSGGNPNDSPENPLLKKPELHFTSTRYDEDIDADFYVHTDGTTQRRYLRNSAGDPFVLTRPRARLNMQYTVNKPFYDPRTIAPLHGCINSRLFIDYFFAYECLFVGHSAADHFEPICKVYWTITMDFEIRFRDQSNYYERLGWRDTYVADRGHRERIDGKMVTIDEMGVAGQVQNLNGNGRRQDTYVAAVTEWNIGPSMNPPSSIPQGSPYHRFPVADFTILQ